MAQDLYLIELTRNEIGLLQSAIAGAPENEHLSALSTDLADLEPYAGLVIEAPESAVDHIKVTAGTRRALPLSVAIISEGGRTHTPTVTRDLAFTLRVFRSIHTQQIIAETVRAIDATRAQLMAIHGSADACPDDVKTTIEDLAQTLLSALNQIKPAN